VNDTLDAAHVRFSEKRKDGARRMRGNGEAAGVSFYHSPIMASGNRNALGEKAATEDRRH